ncbi:MAG: Tetraacyldisaccharide 4-kinase [Pseudomonadota bacterium]
MHWLHQLPRHWHKKSALTVALWPMEMLYRLALFTRHLLYALGLRSSQTVNATVIVVGNIVAGGGGKTPLTIALVQRLKQQGLKVGVVSRGYGRSAQDVQMVQANSSPEQVGDEPLLIHRKCQVPVAVGAKRVDAARQLLIEHPEVNILVCDDGLQHWSLKRDIEICVMDSMGIGNGRLLPAGPLREAWPRKVDLLLHTHNRSMTEGFESKRQLSPTAINGFGQELTLKALQQEAVEVVCGIAKPEAFAEMLKDCNIQISHLTALPDHDDFAQWQPMHSQLKLLCTEKDAVKLWQKQPQAFAVPLLFEPEPQFWLAFDALLESRHRYH